MIMYDNAIYVDARIYGCAILDGDLRIGDVALLICTGLRESEFCCQPRRGGKRHAE